MKRLSKQFSNFLIFLLLFVSTGCFFTGSKDLVSGQTTEGVEFLYTASGQRLAKLVENEDHTYYLPGVEVTINEADGTTSYRRYYTFNGVGVAVRDSDGLSYSHGDNLGSVSLSTNTSGVELGEQVYYPYGTTKTISGSIKGERRYTGQVTDENVTGFYYYNARYYSPAMGRFTQPDTIDSGLNRYAYVGNNPVNVTDPSGHAPSKIMHDWDEKPHQYCSFSDPACGQQNGAGKILASLRSKNDLLKPLRGKTSQVSQIEISDTVPLTGWGKNAENLYSAYRDTPGWWNDYEVDNFTAEDFLALMLSYEFGPLAAYSNKNIYDRLTSDLTEATVRWLYGKCEYESGSVCNTATPNSVFNWVGGALESFQRRWRAVYLDSNGYLREMDQENLNRVTKNEGRDSAMAESAVSAVMNPSNTSWIVTSGADTRLAPYYWGNGSMFTSYPSDYLWKFGSGNSAFYVLSVTQNAAAHYGR